jgi:hypothetical protein
MLKTGTAGGMNNHKAQLRLAGLYGDYQNNLITLGELSDGVDAILNEVRNEAILK